MKTILAALLALASFAVQAQSLTNAQLTTLKACINANASMLAAWQSGNPQGVADLLNATASPAWIVWRKVVPSEEIGRTVNYVAVGSLTATNLARVTDFLKLNPVEFDPSRSDIRDYFNSAFGGALGGQGQATRDALEAMYRRSATAGEKCLSTGTGSTASPATLTWEGAMPFQFVIAAMGT